MSVCPKLAACPAGRLLSGLNENSLSAVSPESLFFPTGSAIDDSDDEEEEERSRRGTKMFVGRSTRCLRASSFVHVTYFKNPPPGFIANKKVLLAIIILIVIRVILQTPSHPLTPRKQPAAVEYASGTKL